MATPDLVLVARFGAPHGVRGEIRLKSFTETPRAVLDYGPLSAADGRHFELTSARPAAGKSADMLVVRVKGVASRNDAERLTGLDLSVPRIRLPAIDADDFYHADLIGLRAETIGGEPLGVVTTILNHGAGDILEIAPSTGPTLLVPFTLAAVPNVEIAAGRVVIDPEAAGLGEDETPPEEEA